jgi:uncharacterized protein (DUF2141 family)
MGRDEDAGSDAESRGDQVTGSTAAVVVAGFLVFLFGAGSPIAVQPSPGTARISGVVVDAIASGSPVRRANVRLSGNGSNRSVVTNDEGRFVMSDLPAGRYTLSVSKPAYLTTEFGARAPGRPGTPLTIEDGQTMAGLQVRLTHGAAVAGTIRDVTGEPVSGVQVSAWRIDETNRATPAAGGSAAFVSDDRGAYRLYGLAAGEYLIGAMPVGSGMGEMGVRSEADVDRALAALANQTREPASRARGTAPAALPPVSASRRMNYATVLYPGTLDVSQALRVRVAAGEERTAVDIPLTLGAMSSVTGTVIGVDGQPAQSVTVAIAMESAPLATAVTRLVPRSEMAVGVGGRFGFANVSPGTYVVTARSGASGRGRGAGAASELLWASASVTAIGVDVSGVTLQLKRSLTISGRVAFEGATRSLDPSQVSVTVRPSNPDAPPTASGIVKPDGSFEIRGLIPGSHELDAIGPGIGPAGAWLRSAILNGRDALDAGLEIGDSDLSGLTITFTDRHSEIGGVLETTAGTAATDYFVVVFPQDPALWRSPRRVASTRPATDGRFAFADLPAGAYLLAALIDVADGELRTADFLSQVAPAGVKVSLGEGQRVQQRLRIAVRIQPEEPIRHPRHNPASIRELATVSAIRMALLDSHRSSTHRGHAR